MIDIIIPTYNAHKTLEYTLMSIAMQKIKDKLNVYIVDDASFVDYNDIVNKFTDELNIKILKLTENVGSGAAREYGIKNSDGDYILFIDSDDQLINPESLEKLYNNKQDYDLIYGKIFNEETNKTCYTNGDLHGKLYKRKFITDNDIHFNNSRYHEDNLFNSLIKLHNPKTKVIDEVIYFYSYNENSITHDSTLLQFMRNEIYIENMNYVVNIAIKHKCDTKLLIEYLLNKYRYLLSVYNDADKDKKKLLKDWINNYSFDKHLKLFENFRSDRIDNII